MKKFEYVNATSTQQAVSLLSKEGSKAMAGGTDLLGQMRDGIEAPEMLVNLKSIPGLVGVSSDPSGGLRIGAMTSLTQLANTPEVRQRFAVLAQAAEAVASPQIRNMATVGGNVCQRPRCWYYRNNLADCYKKGGDRCFAVTGDSRYHAIFGQAMCFAVHPSDLAPVLVALDARAKIVGPKGDRVVPMEKFFVTPREDVLRETILERGEVLTEITVPPLPSDTRAVFIKERERGSWDFATVGVTALIKARNGKAETVRIVLGGVAPIPWRIRGAEEMVAGIQLSLRQMASIDSRDNLVRSDRVELAQAAANAALSGARALTFNTYKIELAKALIKRGILATT